MTAVAEPPVRHAVARRDEVPLRPTWSLHRILQAAFDGQVYTDGTQWHLDGAPATEPEHRAITTLLDHGLAQALPGDAAVGTRHPGLACDAWIDLTGAGKYLLIRWGQYIQRGRGAS